MDFIRFVGRAVVSAIGSVAVMAMLINVIALLAKFADVRREDHPWFLSLALSLVLFIVVFEYIFKWSSDDE